MTKIILFEKNMFSNLLIFLRDQNYKFFFLVLMLSVLPILEAPKNLFALLFVLSWFIIALRAKDWGGRWRLIDTIFLLWLLADIAVGINAVIIHDQPANGSKDIIRFVLVGWAISRARFTTKQMVYLTLMAIFFTIIPLAYSYLNYGLPRLHSVGAINHVAIYILIIYIASLSLLIFNFKGIGNLIRISLILASIILAITVLDTNSRAASGLLVIITLMAIAYAVYLYRSWSVVTISALFISIVLITSVYNPPSVINKFVTGSSLISDSSSRHKIRNFAYYVFKIDPILGTGMENFPNFDHADIQDMVIKEEGTYNKKKFLPFNHPHNVYLAYLSGGGLVLFSIFGWFWFEITKIVHKMKDSCNDRWFIFASSSVIMSVLGIGLVNTTFANEHALIAMLLLGFLISRYREFTS